MNATTELMQEIRDQYYWVGDRIFDKNVVHGLILFVVISAIVIIAVWWKYDRKGDR